MLFIVYQNVFTLQGYHDHENHGGHANLKVKPLKFPNFRRKRRALLIKSSSPEKEVIYVCLYKQLSGCMLYNELN